jgi:predicted small secreted protein
MEVNVYKVICVAVAAVVLAGCSTVQGVVRDRYSGSPIAAAVVTVDNTTASTNGMGHYSLQGSFLPGDTMMVNAPCYNIYTGTITSTNEIKDVNLTPKCGNNELENGSRNDRNGNGSTH